jgi:glycyl-tRNA synthetase alpha chain
MDQNRRAQRLTYRDVYHQNEVEQSTYNFEQSNAPKLFELFAFSNPTRSVCSSQAAAARIRDDPQAAHAFNLLDARGAISVTERAAYIGRLRAVPAMAQAYVDSRGPRLSVLPDQYRARAA